MLSSDSWRSTRSISERSGRPNVLKLCTSFSIRSTAMALVASTPSTAFTIFRTSTSSSSSTTSSSRMIWRRASALRVTS